MPKYPNELINKMKELGIENDKLEEQFIKSSGSGGQNVNKVSTCVQLYDPTNNVRVQCQLHRTQWQNRVGARELLCLEVEKKQQQLICQSNKELHKKRVACRKRSKSMKQKILADKKEHKLKKTARKSVKWDQSDN